MNNDIRVSCSFPEHYKTKKLAAMAGPSAPYSLVCLWIFAARNKPDGYLDNMDSFDVEVAANWTGQPGHFFDAAVKCKFINVESDGFYLHDWQEHQPYASGAIERSGKARFSILARNNKALHEKLKGEGVTSITAEEYKMYTNRIRAEQVTNTKSYEIVTPSPSPSPFPSLNKDDSLTPKKAKGFDANAVELPECLKTDAFSEAWTLWQQHRKEKKNPLTPTATKQQLKKLEEMGEARAVAAIRHSIAGGYAGIFEPKNGATQGLLPDDPNRPPGAVRKTASGWWLDKDGAVIMKPEFS